MAAYSGVLWAARLAELMGVKLVDVMAVSSAVCSAALLALTLAACSAVRMVLCLAACSGALLVAMKAETMEAKWAAVLAVSSAVC